MRYRPWKLWLWTAAACVACWVGLMVVGGLVGALAKLHGCQLDDASPHPCIVFGKDLGRLVWDWCFGPLTLVAYGTPLFMVAVLFFLGAALLVWLFTRGRYLDRP